MAPDLPTLAELAEVTGQDEAQLRRDARAAAEPRTEESGDSQSVADD